MTRQEIFEAAKEIQHAVYMYVPPLSGDKVIKALNSIADELLKRETPSNTCKCFNNTLKIGSAIWMPKKWDLKTMEQSTVSVILKHCPECGRIL